MATVNKRVHQNCANASNPYHECGMACLEKIAQGQGQGQKEKKKLGSWSFGRKTSDSQPNSPPVLEKVSVGDKQPEARYGQSEFHTKKKVESKNGHAYSSSEQHSREIHSEDHSRTKKAESKNDHAYSSSEQYSREIHPEDHSRTKKKAESENDHAYSSSEQHSREIHPEDHSFNQKEVQSPQPVPPPVNVKTDRSKDPPKENVTFPITASPKHTKDEKIQTARDVHHNAENDGEKIARSTVLWNFSFTGTDTAPGDSDVEESESIISDSVSVGKYHVRASVSLILESILNRYGDIAANCKLESNSMRAYYLECLCSVVQELQSSSLAQMNKAKVKEMLAVLKDVESVQIDVDWLRNILIAISEAIELRPQHQTVEAAKANCDSLLESTREELESQMKELSVKEKEVADLKALIAQTKNRLSELEFESTHLEETIKSTRSKVEKFSHKSLAEELL